VTRRPGAYFRAGAAAVILNADGLALAIERADTPGAWQCPQGGLKDGETALAAAIREVAEETGIASEDIERVAEFPVPLVYVLPPHYRTAKTGLGQVQFWFVFRCRRPVTVSLGQEARSCAWRSFGEIAEQVADFRRPVYERLRPFVEAHGGAPARSRA